MDFEAVRNRGFDLIEKPQELLAPATAR